MGYLEGAHQSLAKTIDHLAAGTATDEKVMIGIMTSQAWAAIAQAEQLKRIADMMESDRRAAKTEQDARAFAAQVKLGR